MEGNGDFPKFDPQGPELVYAMIADHLEARIRHGDFNPGQRLPAERELAENYGVAYMTMRRAIRELRERGLVLTVVGKGNFVVRELPRNPPPDATVVE
jgi:DNA-binding GntR family transcriptional regulator